MKALEKWIFYALIFFLPWQTRVILRQWGEPFNEWNSISLYLTDLVILAVIFLWLWRLAKKESSFKAGKAEAILLVFLASGALSLFRAQNFWLGVFREIKVIEMAVLFLYVKGNLFFLCHSGPVSRYGVNSSGNPDSGSGSRLKAGMTNYVNFEIILKTFVASGLLQAIIAIGQFIRQKSFGLSFLDESPVSAGLAGVAKIVVDGEKFIRPYGLTPHPNILAAFLLIAIFCALYLFTEKNKNFQWPRAIGYAAILSILVLAFFLTFSRTVIVIGLVAIFGWLIYLLFCNKYSHPSLDDEGAGGGVDKISKHHSTSVLPSTEGRRKFGLYNSRWYILNTIVIFSVICLLVIILFWPFLSARFDVGTSLADQALNLRVFYNKVALQFISQNPFLGVSIGNFVPAFQASQALSEPWMYQPAHNIYLLIASEIGIIGLLAFLSLLFLVVKNAWGILNDPDKSHWLFAICVLLVIGLFDHFFWTLQQGQLMFWILLGIMASSTTKEYWAPRTL